MSEKKQNITIDEQDLFNYVFFPRNIPEEKKNVIEQDKEFDELINFYRKLKDEAESDIDFEVKRKIASKIIEYSLPNIIQLYPQIEPAVTKTVVNGFAADSKELKPKMTTKTFVDNDKEYLIKVLTYGGITKVFVFSTKDEVVKNFDIIIEPNNLKYHFEDNSEPLKIEKDIEAEKIEIRFS